MQQSEMELTPAPATPTSLDYIKRIYEHVRWADALSLNALRAASGRPAKALEIYAHILAAEHVWLSRLRGAAASLPVWPSLDIDECAALAQRNSAEYAGYLARLTPAALESVVAYHNSAGVAFESKIADVLLQVALHGAYHRGQVALLLRQDGAVPAPTDYIAYVRGAPAARRDSPSA